MSSILFQYKIVIFSKRVIRNFFSSRCSNLGCWETAHWQCIIANWLSGHCCCCCVAWHLTSSSINTWNRNCYEIKYKTGREIKTKTLEFTDEVDGLWEEHPDVRRHAVLHPEGHVAQLVLEQVRAGWRDVEDGRDAAALEQLLLRRVMRTAQEQKGQDLYRTTLQSNTHTHTHGVRCLENHNIICIKLKNIRWSFN